MADKDFAYVDKHGVIHIVDVRETALSVAKGSIVEVDAEVIPNSSGYPEINGKHVIADIVDKTITLHGADISLKDLPVALQALLVQLGYQEQ